MGIKVLISGGGTGGHIFPAISIANAVKASRPDCDILFVGAEGRMEMQRVPEAGYRIVGLPISGFDRTNMLKNAGVAVKYIISKLKARKIIRTFRPDVAVGVGGYASGAALSVAAAKGVPTLIQEQNSYAGMTNKMLSKKARVICVAYSGMERFFPANKIMLTGNPVRQSLTENSLEKAEAARILGLDPKCGVVLLIGGSLGARTLNESVMASLELIREAKDVEFVWQTGKFYFKEMQRRLASFPEVGNLHAMDFVSHMDAAYAAADLVVSRAGASSISELSLLGKPAVLVPSPNVAEDHQTKNAMALATRGAAVHISDSMAATQLIPEALELVRDTERLGLLSENISKLALPDSAAVIAAEVIKLAEM